MSAIYPNQKNQTLYGPNSFQNPANAWQPSGGGVSGGGFNFAGPSVSPIPGGYPIGQASPTAASPMTPLQQEQAAMQAQEDYNPNAFSRQPAPGTGPTQSPATNQLQDLFNRLGASTGNGLGQGTPVYQPQRTPQQQEAYLDSIGANMNYANSAGQQGGGYDPGNSSGLPNPGSPNLSSGPQQGGGKSGGGWSGGWGGGMPGRGQIQQFGQRWRQRQQGGGYQGPPGGGPTGEPQMPPGPMYSRDPNAPLPQLQNQLNQQKVSQFKPVTGSSQY